jgi:hypothetical protein
MRADASTREVAEFIRAVDLVRGTEMAVNDAILAAARERVEILRPTARRFGMSVAEYVLKAYGAARRVEPDLSFDGWLNDRLNVKAG